MTAKTKFRVCPLDPKPTVQGRVLGAWHWAQIKLFHLHPNRPQRGLGFRVKFVSMFLKTLARRIRMKHFGM